MFLGWYCSSPPCSLVGFKNILLATNHLLSSNQGHQLLFWYQNMRLPFLWWLCKFFWIRHLAIRDDWAAGGNPVLDTCVKDMKVVMTKIFSELKSSSGARILKSTVENNPVSSSSSMAARHLAPYSDKSPQRGVITSVNYNKVWGRMPGARYMAIGI